MKVKEIMERAGINQTGRAIAYIKDGLEEIELFAKQNVVRGSLVNVLSNTISFNQGTVLGASLTDHTDIPSNNMITNPDWTGATGSTKPNDWTLYETEASNTDPTYLKLSHVLSIIMGSGASSSGQGIYQAITTIPGITYTLSGSTGSLTTGCDFRLRADGSAGGGLGNADIQWDHTEADTYKSVDFVATHATTYITVMTYNGDATQVGQFLNPILIPTYHYIYTSSSDVNFTNLGFTTSHKLLVNSSTNFDTDKSSNAASGYYTINKVDSSYMTISNSNIILAEVAGSNITLRGQTINYMDIIKDKRFYELPDDMLKLMSIKIKNHKNGNDKYKSVERAIYAPSEQDGDNI